MVARIHTYTDPLIVGNYLAYRSWVHMHHRCNPNGRNKTFRHWGGRGISVCERWGEFANFVADMGDRPVGLTLDRIDNDGNYEPGNCRWATWSQQAKNRRRPAGASSQYRGVSKVKNAFQAFSGSGADLVYLGRYPSEHQAAAARYAKIYVLAQSESAK